MTLTYLAVGLFVLILSEFVEILECGDFYQIGNSFGNLFLFGVNMSGKACCLLFRIFFGSR